MSLEFPKYSEELFERIGEALNENDVIEFEKKLEKPRFTPRLNAITIAACIVVLFGGIYFGRDLFLPVNESLFNRHYSTYEIKANGTYRGENASRQELLYWYSENAFDEFLEKSLDLVKKDSVDFQLMLLNGVALIELEDYSGAVEVLSQLHKAKSFYSDEASWYLALLMIKQKRYDEAIINLEDVSSSKGHFSNKEAILNRLERINQ